jgi:hypothetical protein
MNRRGFLATLAGAAVAPFLPKPKPKPPTYHGSESHRFFEALHQSWGKDDPLWAVHESTERMVEEFDITPAEIKAGGESFSMSKGLVSIEGILGRKGT